MTTRDGQMFDESNQPEGPFDGQPDEEMEVIEGDVQDVIQKLIEQRDDYLDQLQRSRAEFINYRKRTDQERLRLGDMFTANALKQFLPVIDDFDRAIAAVPAEEMQSGWMSGITMIQKKLAGILEKAGVTEVPGAGQPFDPAVHEAVASEPGSTGQTVAEVYQKGYILNDTLLRPAMVKTGDAPTEQFNA